MANLNEEQRQAVIHFDSPLLIVAGAGSGKTRVITHKIAYLMQEYGISPTQILGVTFTNRAADEMKLRIEALTDIQGRFFQISTFHSFGLRVLREAGAAAGFDSGWKVIDDDEQRRIIERLAKEFYPNLSSDDRNAIVRRIGMAKMNMIYPNRPDLLQEKGLNEEDIDLFDRYYEYQQAQRLWDYEDLISLTVKLLENVETALIKYQDRFRYILIDEFQDINPNQYELIRLIGRNCRNVTAVGDDDQAIYSWRGASIRFLLNYERDFPGTCIIKLEQNYRSSQNILEFANQLIAFNSMRKGKKMWTELEHGHRIFLMKSRSKEEEAMRVARLITLLKESHPELFPLAVLYRINSQSLQVETELLKQGIPFQILKGLRFFERKEIKDTLALLRLAIQPDDNLAFERVCDCLPLGIGEKTLETLHRQAMVSGASLFRTLEREFPDRFRQKKIFGAISRLHDATAAMAISDLFQTLLTESGYSGQLQDRGEEERLLNIAELADFIESWERDNPGETFQQLLDRMSLESVRKGDESQEKVFLLTMHNAKGLEFQSVVVIGVNSAYLPFFLRKERAEIEEERRLFYVASTRAMKLLVMSTGSERSSPFLLAMNPTLYSRVEVPQEILSTMSPQEEREWVSEVERYLLHPIFGRGRIVEELPANKYLVNFSDRGNKMIDASVVRVEIE